MYLQLPLRQWGAGNVDLLVSVVQLKGKQCRKPHCRIGVVDTFGHSHSAGLFDFLLVVHRHFCRKLEFN